MRVGHSVEGAERVGYDEGVMVGAAVDKEMFVTEFSIPAPEDSSLPKSVTGSFVPSSSVEGDAADALLFATKAVCARTIK